MECATISQDIDDGPAVFKKSNPVARKEHTCHECKRTIPKGEKYRSETGCWEGDWLKYKTCGDCLSLRQAFFKEGFWYGMILESVENHVGDLDGQVPSSCFADLTPGAKDKLFVMMDRHILEGD